MIHVIASITIAEGEMETARSIYRAFVPEVEAERGCLLYCPTLDYQTGIVTQVKDANVITVIEKWEDEASFVAHLSAPHVIAFRERMQKIMQGVSIKVLKDML